MPLRGLWVQILRGLGGSVHRAGGNLRCHSKVVIKTALPRPYSYAGSWGWEAMSVARRHLANVGCRCFRRRPSARARGARKQTRIRSRATRTRSDWRVKFRRIHVERGKCIIVTVGE